MARLLALPDQYKAWQEWGRKLIRQIGDLEDNLAASTAAGTSNAAEQVAYFSGNTIYFPLVDTDHVPILDISGEVIYVPLAVMLAT